MKGVFYLFCAFSLAGTSVIAARFLDDNLGVFTITAVSLFFALLCLLPLGLRELVKTVRRLSLRDWILLSFQALFGVFLFRMFLLYGLVHTSAGEAGIITGATPAVTVLLAMFLLKETVNRTALLGIGSTVAGILLIQKLFAPGSISTFSIHHLAGNVLVLCAAVSESLFNIFSRFAVKTEASHREPLHPIAQTTLVTAMALTLCLIPAFFEHPVSSLFAIGWKQWLALVWYGPFVTALAFIFWYAGIKRCDAQTAAALSGMMPFSALFLSVIVLGERAGWQQWSGGLLVILGMILIGANQQSETDRTESLSFDAGDSHTSLQTK
ncbi:DMT family transporter [Brevibacillus ruminantium]|uniref:DMT family transporter n=1 Tax=Brevibacillus ruminantium TaxID=2950604 RepID=A0ABY4WP05_9BACL|nr:DMT family transporter [Brevibacillus ruminantium]USG68491.1 DMT family transporter [Brevibacillus ruminantium]